MMIENSEKYRIYKPKKFLGQNFLVDENIAKKIVESLDIKKDDFIFEIGPGHGALTKYIAGITRNFIAVDIDKEITKKLKERFEDKDCFINEDILSFSFEKYLPKKFSEFKIIGNIPYNLTSEILFKILTYSLQDQEDNFIDKPKINKAILMIQKEVALRLCANKDSKQYGILSVQTQAFSNVKILFNVPRTAFFPKPDIVSSVIEIRPVKDKYKINNVSLFRSLVRNAFGKRRKTLKNSLDNFIEENGFRINDIGFDFSRRAESLSIEEFVNLSNLLLHQKYKNVP